MSDRIAVLDEGRLLQLATPDEVYNRPVNRFVAGFIGSPAMNFLEGRVFGGRFVTEGVDYPLDSASEKLAEGPATLGFRPEDLCRARTGEPKLIDATLQVVERMGHETVVYFTLFGQSMVARLAGDSGAKPGESISLGLTQACWHLFASDDTGIRLCSGGAE